MTSRKYSTKLIDLLDEGFLEHERVLKLMIGYFSEQNIQNFCEDELSDLFEEDDESDTDDDSDADDEYIDEYDNFTETLTDTAFNVYCDGELIDTVFNQLTTAHEVRRALIEHDGYSRDIIVVGVNSDPLVGKSFEVFENGELVTLVEHAKPVHVTEARQSLIDNDEYDNSIIVVVRKV